MPLTGTGDALGTLMDQYIDALSVAQKKQRIEIMKAMGRAVVAHFTTPPVSTGAVAVPGATGGGGGLPGNLQ